MEEIGDTLQIIAGFHRGLSVERVKECIRVTSEAYHIPEEDIYQIIGRIYRAKILPLPKKEISLEDLNRRFRNLSQYKAHFAYNMPYSIRNTKHVPLYYNSPTGQRYRYALLVNYPDDYLRMNLVSDFWMDSVRLQARVGDQSSPADFWKKSQALIHDEATKRFGDTSQTSLREVLYSLSREATSFRPTNIVAIIKLFKSTRILDFSAGWGDRLIGAMSQDQVMGGTVKYYLGVDPNHRAFVNYQKIIDYFTGEFRLRGTYQMIESPFETAKIPRVQPFDLVFTSPPYFDFEIYDDGPSQSVHDRNLDQWFNDFLVFSIKKSLNVLRFNGFLVIVINDIRGGAQFTKRMIEKIKTLPRVEFRGVISYTMIRRGRPVNPLPMWIFRKR